MKIGIDLPNQVGNARLHVLPEWAQRAGRRGFPRLGLVGCMAYPGAMDTAAPAGAVL